MTEAKPKERMVLNVSVSITDTDVFKHVLTILGVIYRNTKDEDLKKYIEEELDRIVANILRQQEETHSMEIYELCCTPMERFWEQVIFGLIKRQETRT